MAFTPISENFLGSPLEFELGDGQEFDDFTLDDAAGGGGSTGSLSVPFVASLTAIYAIQLPEVDPPFIASVTTVYSVSFPVVPMPFIASATVVRALQVPVVPMPFIGSTTTLHAIELPEVPLPFVGSQTSVFGVFSLFTDVTGSGPGNGGESFAVMLAPNGTTETGILAASITDTATLLSLTGDGGMPSSEPFCLTIDDEVLYVAPIGSGLYRVRRRGMSNTTPAAHTAAADATWTDTYDMSIVASGDVAHQFTADITSTGSYTYPGWLVCFDSSQAYLSGGRYPMHVTEVLGVFDAGAGSSGSNRCDAAQPNSIATPAGSSDDCPAALSNPSRIQADILAGDVALVRYTNPEASALELGARSVALQSWFGMKRVDAFDVDVTLTDPSGTVVDGSVNGEWHNPLGPGIGPDTGLPTSHDVPYTSVTLLGSDRNFTVADEKGWPICALAVRQGTRRIPLWRSWDWHNYNFVYSGFDADATYCQLVVNRNGVVFDSVPEADLPGPQDIDGPDAVWDDGSYYFGASWYVAIYAGPYLVMGPSIGGLGGSSGGVLPGDRGVLPVVEFTGGPTSPVVTVPDVEGGSGGGIPAPSPGTRFSAAVV